MKYAAMALAMMAGLCLGGCLAGDGGPAEPYNFSVSYESVKVTAIDSDEDDVVSGGTNGVRVVWYPESVEDDEYPYAVQPYMQRASFVELAIGGGDYDFHDLISTEPADSIAVDLEGTYFHKDSGLAGRVGFHSETISLEGQDDLKLRSYDATLMIQTESGFSAELGYQKASQAFYFDESFFDGGDRTEYWAIHVATGQVFRFPGAQALLYSVAYEFGTYDLRELYGIEPRFSKTETVLTYFPIKDFGIGISIAPVFFDNDAGMVATRHRFEVGVHLTGTIAQRWDVSVDLTGFTNDLHVAGQPYSYSDAVFALAYRF